MLKNAPRRALEQHQERIVQRLRLVVSDRDWWALHFGYRHAVRVAGSPGSFVIIALRMHGRSFMH